MNIEEFRDFCLSFPDTYEDTPFNGFFSNSKSLLVFYFKKKIFCLINIDQFDSCTIKCKTDKIEELKDSYTSINNPFNFSKKYWISIAFNKDLPDTKIFELVEESYTIVRESVSKKTL